MPGGTTSGELSPLHPGRESLGKKTTEQGNYFIPRAAGEKENLEAALQD